MKQLRLLVILLTIFALSSITWADNKPVDIGKDKQVQKFKESHLRLPLYFIENKGQLDEKVRFYERGNGHSVFFTQEGIYMALNKKQDKGYTTDHIVIKPINANEKSDIIPEQRLKGKVNYFIGNDQKRWKTDIPTYSKVR